MRFDAKTLINDENARSGEKIPAKLEQPSTKSLVTQRERIEKETREESGWA